MGKITDCFDNKVVVVTGSTRGIGKEVAKSFLSLGANVVINYKEQTKIAHEFVKTLPSKQILLVQADISSEYGVKKLISTTIQRFGKINILVNNAGSIKRKNWKAELSEWNQMISSNLTSSWLMIRETSPYLKMNTGSCIVNVSSIFGTLGEASVLPYSVAKGGVITLTKSMAKELAPEIRVNTIVPGNVKTEMSETANRDRIEKIEQSTLLKRSAIPSEIADAVLFLASERASYITGQILSVDGGYSLK